MKKHLIAAAVAGAFAVPAMAQVTVSGSIQAGIIDDGAAGSSAVVATRLGGGANAINITSSEDLGGGLTAGFRSQMRFDSTGTARATSSSNAAANAAGPLFHDANLFISGGFGTFRVGKIFEDSNCGFDPWGCGGGAGLSAGSDAGALVAAASQDRSVYYQTPIISGLRLSVQSTLVNAASPATERKVYNITYASGPLSAQYIMMEQSDKVEQSGFGLSYNFGVATVMAGTAVTESAAGVKTRDIKYVGGAVPLGGALTGLVGYSKNDGVGVSSQADTRWALGVNYALSKRTTVGADVFEREAVGSSTGFVLRARHTF